MSEHIKYRVGSTRDRNTSKARLPYMRIFIGSADAARSFSRAFIDRNKNADMIPKIKSIMRTSGLMYSPKCR